MPRVALPPRIGTPKVPIDPDSSGDLAGNLRMDRDEGDGVVREIVLSRLQWMRRAVQNQVTKVSHQGRPAREEVNA